MAIAVDDAIILAVKAGFALQEFLTKGLPVLQQSGAIIQKMQAAGLQIPALEDQKALQAQGASLDAAADAAISQAARPLG